MPQVTFLNDAGANGPKSIDVPAGTTILEAAKKLHAQVGYACGGVCACSTCHVYVKAGLASLSPQKDREEDILDKAFDVRASSRLGLPGQAWHRRHRSRDHPREPQSLLRRAPRRAQPLSPQQSLDLVQSQTCIATVGEPCTCAYDVYLRRVRICGALSSPKRKPKKLHVVLYAPRCFALRSRVSMAGRMGWATSMVGRNTGGAVPHRWHPR